MDDEQWKNLQRLPEDRRRKVWERMMADTDRPMQSVVLRALLLGMAIGIGLHWSVHS